MPSKHVRSFFRSLEMPLVNCKIDLELTWHKGCMISSVNAAAGQVVSFMIKILNYTYLLLLCLLKIIII